VEGVVMNQGRPRFTKTQFKQAGADSRSREPASSEAEGSGRHSAEDYPRYRAKCTTLSRW
jgi:hypothetical protein